MINWYIGQPIVAIVSHNQGKFKKGDEFTIKGLRGSFCKCGGVEINVGIIGKEGIENCTTCNIQRDSADSYHWFSEKRFAPLDVNISELTEILSEPIKETQPLNNQLL